MLLVVVLATGCDQGGIQVYTVPKEQSLPMPHGDHPDHGMPAAPALTWKTPAGWQELPAGEFRVASFKVTGQDGKQADVSVIPLPGAAGGDFSNVNRWRGQVGLSPVSEEEIKKLAQPVEMAAQPASLYEQDGKNADGAPVRILAVIQHREGTAWFFKMTGDSQLVEQAKPAFVEFLKSVQFAAATGAPAASSGKPQWNAPSGWKEVDGGQFLVAKFAVAGEGNAQAAVNISSSAGDGGGMLGNVNRWRAQLGLPPLDQHGFADSMDNPPPGGPRCLVDITGTDSKTGKPARLVGAIVPQSGQTWFYKLMGDGAVVSAQKEAFIKFVQEVKY